MPRKKAKSQDNFTYVLPSVNEELASFITKHKYDMMEQVVSSIEYAIEHKLPMVEVFQFKGCQFVVTLSEREFEANLDNIYNSYMQDEAYELCPRVVKLRNLVKRIKNEESKTPTSGNKRKPTSE